MKIYPSRNPEGILFDPGLKTDFLGLRMLKNAITRADGSGDTRLSYDIDISTEELAERNKRMEIQMALLRAGLWFDPSEIGRSLLARLSGDYTKVLGAPDIIIVKKDEMWPACEMIHSYAAQNDAEIAGRVVGRFVAFHANEITPDNI